MQIQLDTAPPPAASPEAAALQPQIAPKSAVQTAAPPSAETTKQAARQINEFLKSSAADIEFTVDRQLDKVVVRVVDSQTKQLIRQMPSEEMIALSKSIDQMTSLLINQKA